MRYVDLCYVSLSLFYMFASYKIKYVTDGKSY